MAARIGEVAADAPFVDADPDRADEARGLQIGKRSIGAIERRAKKLRLPFAVRPAVDVVDTTNVDALELEPRQALLERAERTLPAVVENNPQAAPRAAHLLRFRLSSGSKKASDLGGDDELIARPVREVGADAALAIGDTVQRRRIEVADTFVPRGVDCLAGDRVGVVADEVSDRAAAEPERR